MKRLLVVLVVLAAMGTAATVAARRWLDQYPEPADPMDRPERDSNR